MRAYSPREAIATRRREHLRRSAGFSPCTRLHDASRDTESPTSVRMAENAPDRTRQKEMSRALPPQFSLSAARPVPPCQRGHDDGAADQGRRTRLFASDETRMALQM